MDLPSKPPRLLAQVRAAIRVHQLSPRTEMAYLGWIRRYVRFHGLRHPATMGTDEVVAFLSHLATEGRVVQSTQTQALSPLLLLYRDVIRKPLLDSGPWYGRGCRRGFRSSLPWPRSSGSWA